MSIMIKLNTHPEDTNVSLLNLLPKMRIKRDISEKLYNFSVAKSVIYIGHVTNMFLN